MAKPATKKTTTTAKKTATKEMQQVLGMPQVDADLRRRMVAEAAYYRAERRGFQGGSEYQDWLEAEAEVTRILEAR